MMSLAQLKIIIQLLESLNRGSLRLNFSLSIIIVVSQLLQSLFKEFPIFLGSCSIRFLASVTDGAVRARPVTVLIIEVVVQWECDCVGKEASCQTQIQSLEEAISAVFSIDTTNDLADGHTASLSALNMRLDDVVGVAHDPADLASHSCTPHTNRHVQRTVLGSILLGFRDAHEAL